MPNTITSYYTFVPNTKARSSQVNTNFDNHRGTLLPIEENTQSASNLSHDIGATDHWWRAGYINEMYMGGSTGGWNISPTTTGYLQYNFSATTAFRLGYSASNAAGDAGGTFNWPVQFNNRATFATPMYVPTASAIWFESVSPNVFKMSKNTATARGIKIDFGTTSAAVINYSGAFSENRDNGFTNNGGFGSVGRSNVVTFASTTGNISGSTVTISHIERPIMLCLSTHDDTTGSVAITGDVHIRKDGNTIIRNAQLGGVAFHRTANATTSAIFHIYANGGSGTNIALYAIEL